MIKIKKIITYAAIIPMLFIMLSGCSGANKYKDGSNITLTGYIHLIGNEPFSVLILQTSEGDQIRLSKEDKNNYQKYIGQQVTMHGTIKIKKITTADNKMHFIEYHFTNVQLK